MSKKDFIALADAIREHNRLASHFGGKQFHESQIAILANFCQSQNPNFKRDRWLDYIAGKCGKNGGKVKEAA